MLFAMVQTIQPFLEIPQLLYVSWWSMSLLCRSCRFSVAAVEWTVVLPQLQIAEKIVARRKRQLFRSYSSSWSFTFLLWRRGSFPSSCGP